MSSNQTAAILALLRERGERGVTPIEALELVGSFRLGARTWDLRAEGHHIETERYTTPGGATVARYVLRESRFRPDTGEQTTAWEGAR